MALQMEFSIDWSKTTAKRTVWKPHQRAKNIFKGKSDWEKARVGNTDVLRLSVLPENAKLIPDSFTVIQEPQWSKAEKPKLPLNFEWQQSLPARFDFYFDLANELRCHGLGERFSSLNVRGEKHTVVSTDNPHHNEAIGPMYKPVPFLVVGNGDEYVGIYLDTPAPSRFDLDSELTEEGQIQLFTRRGFRVYILGPSPLREIVSTFTSLVGRAKLPPLWSLGHHQSRWSYPDEKTVQEIAKEFRNRKIPCDTLVIDMDYMDGFRVFTVAKDRFPNFEKLLRDLATENFKVVSSVNPGLKEDPGYRLFAECLKNNYLCKTFDNKLFLDRVWPGSTAFPDFLKPEVREWWAKEQKFLSDAGVNGIWNDMNEPAFFNRVRQLPEPMEQLPPPEEQCCMHETQDGLVPHLEVRNVYGLLMSQAAYDGLLMQRPNERPFVLSRSGGAGIQRYAAVWLGDNRSWYEHLRKSLPMLLNMGMSGVTFAGVDIGGFWDDALPELVVRWYELGIFYPFFRNHCGISDRAQEAFAYAPNVEEMVRKLIETRYRLLPYIRSLFWEHLHTGAPLMRPLSWHYGTDPIACDVDDQFMFGSDMLVAPLMERGRDYRIVYFPEGNWYHFETNERFEGKKAHAIKMPLGTVPAFVREGAIIPLTEVMQHTKEYESKSIKFKIFGKTASCKYFEDDGITFDYEKGKYNEYDLSFSEGKLSSTAVHKDYKPAHKYGYQIAGENDVKAVQL